MGSDNLLAALAGFGQGVNNVLTPYLMGNIDEKRKKRLLQEQAATEMETYKARVPYEMDIYRTKQATDLENKREFLKDEEASKIRVEQAKPQPKTTVLDKSGSPIRTVTGRVAFPPDFKDKEKPLTLEGKKTVGNLDEGITSVKNALALGKKSPYSTRLGTMNVPLFGDVPGRAAVAVTPGASSDDASRFSFEIGQAKDVLQRYRSGAALNNSEFRTYDKLLNDSLASDSVREENLKRVLSFFERVKTEIESGTRQFNPNSSANPQEKGSGQLMEDADGNRAYVYPDGTFEEVE